MSNQWNSPVFDVAGFIRGLRSLKYTSGSRQFREMHIPVPLQIDLGLTTSEVILLFSSFFSSGLIVLAGLLYLRGSKLDSIGAAEPRMTGEYSLETGFLPGPTRRSYPTGLSQKLVRLLLSREILSYAITRIYEVESERRISEEEREQMVRDYEVELKKVNSEIMAIEKRARLEDLEREKGQLMDVISKRVKEIEEDIEKLKVETGIVEKPKLKRVEKRRKKPKKVEEKPESSELEALMDKMMGIMKEMEKLEGEE